MVPTVGRPAMPTRYTLNGVLYHHGKSASGGRYTVDVLHPNAHESSGEAWVRIGDDSVSTVGHYKVEWTDDRYAYLLFYSRTASTQT
jgi:ubiquitin C-terminal hydrolase